MKYLNYQKDIKDYFQSLKKYIVFSFFLFLFAVISGYIFAETHPMETMAIITELKSSFPLEEEMNNFNFFWFIFQHNVSIIFIILLLGIFAGIIPFLYILINGMILGIISQVIVHNFSWSVLFFGIIPHGIIEIPVLIISGAIGLKIGKTAILKIFRKKNYLFQEIKQAIKFYIFILVPFLFIAAFIESFVTSLLLKIIK